MSAEIALHKDYQVLLKVVKAKIKRSQIKAAQAVNTELLLLYWDIGEMIIEQQKEVTWGGGFFKQLSKDIKKEFPDTTGFSATNLDYMKRWVLFYSQLALNSPQLVGELGLDAEQVISPQLVESDRFSDRLASHHLKKREIW